MLSTHSSTHLGILVSDRGCTSGLGMAAFPGVFVKIQILSAFSSVPMPLKSEELTLPNP